MRLVDLQTLAPEVDRHITDAKEGLVDALLNLTWMRCSGDGPEGQTVYGTKPSLRFVSGFLLPRFEELGQTDETSDIHLSTHGMDFQIAGDANGPLRVEASFSIYVRALPSWQELTQRELDIFPNPPLRRDLEEQIRDAMKDRLAEAMEREQAKSTEERRSRGELQQEIYRALLAEHGVRVEAGGLVAGESEPEEGSQEGFPEHGTDDGHALLTVRNGNYIFENDDAAQPIDIPQKWLRLHIFPEPYSADLGGTQESLRTAAATWSEGARSAIREVISQWLGSEEGQNWAYRPATVRPSDFRDESLWNVFLDRLRQQTPSLQEIAPNLDGVGLSIRLDDDLQDTARGNLRVMLENNSRQVGRRRRQRYDHAIHQVRMKVSIPASVHRSLKLDRVETSYRFRDFLTYPAIGINCGVTEARESASIVFRTTWMPRYQQPRILPRKLESLPTSFSVLSGEGFDPRTLRPLIEEYHKWIDQQEAEIDPAAGVEDAEAAERERSTFARDIASYRREASRIELGVSLLEASFQSFRENRASREGQPYRAWLLLNETFFEAGKQRGVTDWRLFQLAFILAHIPTIASRMPEFSKAPWFDLEFDEETATLLYFATGGGKSEAFFGLLIFNLFFDRMRGKEFGVTALIRYPLRLLTLQQAQRLLAILMRAEVVRRERGIGGQPFEIGFWVGSGNTPNRSDDTRLDPVPRFGDPQHADDTECSSEYQQVNASFNKTPICPLCQWETGLRRITSGAEEEIGILCFNSSCLWNRTTNSSPLPFLIVDRDIYRHAPAVLLGVIDKLALIGQHPSTINRVMGMFGFARWKERSTGRLVMPTRNMLQAGPAVYGCEAVAPAYRDGVEVFFDPFPSLIIQDEAHLLEESLGTFSGLFETALEQLFERGADLLDARVARIPESGRPRLPKVVAATATVSVPEHQFGALYQRRHMQFPYPGTALYESFYAAPAIPANPERRGIGGNSPRAPETESPWMRIYASIMTNGHNHTVTTVSVLAAYHLAITELWHDLQSENDRDGAVGRLLDALTPETPVSQFHSEAIRVCAGSDGAVLLTLVDLMRISLTYVTNKKGGDQVIDAFREEVAKAHRLHGRELSQLHTRLISGGVDVAQIQEIMREAEEQPANGALPDLEHSLRNIVATSAISHGVDVDKFNAMFFAGMPNDIAEFIQASSRVGRSHVGFGLLVPTPHARRDRYIVETHDVFHRFLERMISPPAITRWAASAHQRVLTSLFQAWLCGWAEQKLFIDSDSSAKERAPVFVTVNDVNRLLTGRALPDAAADFVEFAVRALGVPGRGDNQIGSAPHRVFYEERIRNLAKQLTDELRTQYTTTKLSEYWPGAPVGSPPMTSLRDIDEAGHFTAARPMGGRRRGGGDDRELVLEALRIVRHQSGRVSELDADQGEG